MLALLRRTRTGFFIAMIGLLCLSVMAPVLTVANNDLLAGDDAIVTEATTLHTDVGYTAGVMAEVDMDTPATILDGPLTASDDGTLWFQVQIWDLTGYMPADHLDAAGSSEESEESTEAESSEDAPATPALPWKEPVDFGVANDNVICRDAASTGANEVVLVEGGQTVEITGEEIWAEDIGWTPVNCAAVGGFISSDFIEVEESGTDEGAEAEEPVDEAPEVAEETVDEAAESDEGDDAPALPTADPIAFGLATDNIVCRGAPGTSAAEIGVVADEATVEITGDLTTAEGMDWFPVNCGDEGGFVASNFVTTEEAATTTEEEQATDSDDTTEEAVPEDEKAVDAEQIVEDVAEEANAEQIIADVAEEADAERIVQEVNESVGIDTGTTTDEASDPESNTGDADADVATEASTSADATDDGAEAGEEAESTSEERVDSNLNTSAVTDTDTSSDAMTEEDASPDGAAEVSDEAGPATDEAGPATDAAVTAEATTDDETDTDVTTEVDETVAEVEAVVVEETPSTGPVDDSQVIGTAEVKGTNGDGLACRTAPDASASIITLMPEAMNVMVLSEPDANGWMSIVCNGEIGFAEAELLWSGGNLVDDFIAEASSYAVVEGTGGGGLNCRSAASMSARVITRFPEGSAVNVRGASQGDWVPVVCGGQNGFVFGAYLTASSNSSGSGNGAGGSSNVGSLVDAVVRTLTSIIGTMNNGGGSNASGNRGSTTAPAVVEPVVDAIRFGNGDHARVSSNLNLRYEPNGSAGVATFAPSGTVVLITGSHAGNGYYPVNWDGLRGYMHGDYLSKTSAALSERGGSANPTSPSGPSGNGSSSTGNAIVDYAMGYVGYPYVWATHGPYSFDCSGFTSWVIKNVVGKEIGYGLWTQVSAGAPVSKSNLQPGDIVFFQNTYKAGLSHVGIYIGGGQFVHAQNASTGVVVSDLNSNYYGSRWYGAVRIN